MVGVFVILVLGAIVEAQKHMTTESRNVNSTEIENDATNAAYDIEDELMFIQSVLSQLMNKNWTNHSVPERGTNDESDEVNEDSNSSSASASYEENTPEETDETSALEASDYEELGRSEGKSNLYTKRKNNLEYLFQMLTRHTNNEASKTNRRIDFEDNGDGSSGLVDIDNPKSNDYNQDDVVDYRARFQDFRKNVGYGNILDTKGRSGHDGSVPKPNINNDRAFYRPPSMHGLFINPGFYQTQPLSFTKIDNRDLIHPTGRWTNLPFRRLDNEAHETSKKAVSPKAWDTDGNAYLYEPEENKIVQQLPLRYKNGR